jgi:hypothetical protein
MPVRRGQQAVDRPRAYGAHGRPAPKRARRATTKDKKVHYAEDEDDEI